MIRRRSAMVVYGVLLSFLAAARAPGADKWISLIGAQVTSNWDVPTPFDHWTTGNDVFMPMTRPETLELKPGQGVMLARGQTKSVEANVATRKDFGDVELQVEFLVPQGSNSGIYLMGRYEVQIKDSYGKPTIDSHDCGAIYQRWDARRGTGREGFEGHTPRVNASRPAGEWQSFDIVFRAPRFDAAGEKTANAVFKVIRLNGVVIHTDVALSGPTRGAAFATEAATGPILLQGNHGPVAFRTIRVREE